MKRLRRAHPRKGVRFPRYSNRYDPHRSAMRGRPRVVKKLQRHDWLWRARKVGE